MVELEKLQRHLQTATFLRERIDPEPGDPAYLHLSDLRLAMEKYRSAEPLHILDYGCGCSPYRSLFPLAQYERADFSGFDDLDYVIDGSGSIPARDQIFDVVLSTQVLEHVGDPEHYLQECRRVLKPGGVLICSTHGSFEDHACPYDFHRWTSYGLRLQLQRTGFTVTEVSRLTTGARAIIFCVDHYLPKLDLPRRHAFGIAIRVLRRLLLKSRPLLHRQCDEHLSDRRVTPEDSKGNEFYVALLATATKPRG
jgi:SAM-dependent methyltransferase